MIARRVRSKAVLVVLVVLVCLVSCAVASAAVGQPVFYLTVKTGQCLVGSAATGNKGYKTVLVVPCSNPAHDFEVYGIGHGGWGHATPPALKSELMVARNTCLALFQRVTGHPLPRTSGWWGFVPDPGTETADYGDKIICSLRTYPAFMPLGAGWHAH
jgi:hypothetical protein